MGDVVTLRLPVGRIASQGLPANQTRCGATNEQLSDFLLGFVFVILNHISMCVSVHWCMPVCMDACRGQKRASDALGLV